MIVCQTGHDREDQFDNLVFHLKKIIWAAMTSETQAKLEKDAELLKLGVFFIDQQSSVLFFPGVEACSSA